MIGAVISNSHRQKFTSQGQKITCSFYFAKGKNEETGGERPPGGDFTKKITRNIWDSFCGL